MRCSNPSVPLLQAAVLDKPKPVVRNEIKFSFNGIILLRSENALHLENGYTERHFIHQTRLTEPQGTLKKRTIRLTKPYATLGGFYKFE